MASLSAIIFNLMGSAIVFILSMLAFGCAVKNQNTYVAARCVARPPEVIYNSDPHKDPCQNRGNPVFGWIPWVMGLTYESMLRGVPGTGTRDQGLSGVLLKVNLDGVVLLRFHHLCLRVCSLACFLYLVVVLPIYTTAQCSRIGGDYGTLNCEGENFNTTEYNYQRLTLANIPTLEFPSPEGFGDMILNFFLPEHSGLLARLYAVVLVTWIVTYYVLSELRKEWGDVLAMRRVYYLEADLWKDRAEELDSIEAGREKVESRRSTEKSVINEDEDESDETFINDRKPWIPHPEQPDTVPNIELYSVLVGGLPSLPTSIVDQEQVGALFSRKQSIDWQLAVTTAFFDHCVPNQPGFSSSIAAVTILPSASHLTGAWNQWYKVAAKLRRLRFIRREINRRQKHSNAKFDIEEGGIRYGEDSLEQSLSAIMDSGKRPVMGGLRADRRINNPETQEVLGSTRDLQVEDKLLYAFNLGPEQTAVYEREFAVGAANLAPYGWHERRVLNASLQELKEMERSAVEAVHVANMFLREAQERIGEDADVSGSDGGDLSDEELHLVMRNVDTSSGNASGKPAYEGVGGTQDATRQRNVDRRLTRDDSRAVGSNDSSFFGSTDDEDSFASLSSGSDDMSEYQIELKKDDKPQATNLKRSNTFGSFHSGGSTSSGKSIESKSGTFGKTRGLGRSNSGYGVGGKRKKRISKANLINTKLPSNLGLEAGLWMERMTLSSHGKRRKQARSESKSSLGHSMHGIHGHRVQDTSLSKRTRSFDNLPTTSSMPVETPAKNGMKRALSSDDVDLLTNVEESAATSSVGLLDNGDGHTRVGLTENSIWERLQLDHERKKKIRDRLHDIQNAEFASEILAANQQVLGSDKADVTDCGSKALSPMNGPDRKINCPTTDKQEGSKKSRGKPSNHSKVGRRKQIALKTEAKLGALHEDHSDDDSSIDIQHDTRRIPFQENIQSTTEDSLKSLSSSQVEGNLKISLAFERNAGLRHRNAQSRTKDAREAGNVIDDKWIRVEAIVNEAETGKEGRGSKRHKISTGSWNFPSFHSFSQFVLSWRCCCKRMKAPDLVDDLVKDSSYAVVTFTSRQAAVAARHCLSDSRGHDRWITVNEIPSPPLADAPAFNASSFRGCVRPVAISISDKQKILRHTLAMGVLAAIYFFYTIPLTLAQQLVSPENLSKIMPDIDRLQENSVFLSNIFSGLIPALVWTAFFAACPPMFKIIANFGSNATSLVTAENSALRYFWWFMLVSAFTGTSFSSAVINGFNEGLNLGSELQKVIETTAATIPKQVSATWLNWMIIRTFAVLPTQYLLQLNTFVFSCLGLRFCARAVRGGGAGGPVPYRIYVDSGVVMLCVFALAPAAPLISATALAYFVFCTPMLRWTLIFLYRPKFDFGGGRFPFIFDICISGIIAGQILLIAMLVLKRAIGPAVLASVPLVPTLWFRYFVRRRYLRAFNDAALLQTSLLDGWDTNVVTSEAKREDFRKFLVDCHKAAYVPVCIAGDQSTTLTAEPAVVVPIEYDDDEAFETAHGAQDSSAVHHESIPAFSRFPSPRTQNMPMMRRVLHSPVRGKHHSVATNKYSTPGCTDKSPSSHVSASTRKASLDTLNIPL